MGETYTYRNGEPLVLVERRDYIVSRATASALRYANFEIAGQLSPHSHRIQVGRSEKGQSIEHARELGLGPVFPDYAIPDAGITFSPKSEFRITDRILVSFGKPLSDTEWPRFHAAYGTEMIRPFDDTSFLLRVVENHNPIDVVRRLHEEEDRITRAEHDVNHRFLPQVEIPQDEGYRKQWHLHPVADDRFRRLGSANVQDAWLELGSTGDPKVVICVIDGGFAVNQPDFNVPGKIVGWAYFEDGKLRTSEDGAPMQKLAEAEASLLQHGTSCAALAAAAIDQKLSVGVAPASKLFLVKLPVDSDGAFILSDTQFVDLLKHIRDKVDIVTSSWASPDPKTEWLDDTVDALASLADDGGRRPGKGIIFFWGAGNFNRPLARRFISNVPVPFEIVKRQGKKTFNTAHTFENNLVGIPNVLHVAASTSNGLRAQYSNHGFGIDLAAPSSNFDPYGCGVPFPGIPIATSSFNGESKGVMDTSFGGTSAASPIAAGIAALVISANPDLGALEVVSLLKRTAERDMDVATKYPRVKFGCFRESVCFDVCPVAPFDDGSFRDIGHADGTWSPWFGFGRVDALRAVQVAGGMGSAARSALRISPEEKRSPAKPKR